MVEVPNTAESKLPERTSCGYMKRWLISMIGRAGWPAETRRPKGSRAAANPQSVRSVASAAPRNHAVQRVQAVSL